MIKKVHKKLEDEWFVIVIALASDGSGETISLRKMAVNADPSLIAPDCFVHQVSDYFFSIHIVLIEILDIPGGR